MANTNRPGFRPISSKNGVGVPKLEVIQAVLDRSADATGNHGDIYIGDPVKLSSGKALCANSGDSIYGVVVAIGKGSTENTDAMFFFNTDAPSQQYAPLSDSATPYWLLVARADDWVFEGCTATALTIAVGATCDINTAAATAHGSRTTSMSVAALTTDFNHDVYVSEVNKDVGEDPTAIYGKYRFVFKTTPF